MSSHFQIRNDQKLFFQVFSISCLLCVVEVANQLFAGIVLKNGSVEVLLPEGRAKPQTMNVFAEDVHTRVSSCSHSDSYKSTVTSENVLRCFKRCRLSACYRSYVVVRKTHNVQINDLISILYHWVSWMYKLFTKMCMIIYYIYTQNWKHGLTITLLPQKV